MLGFIFFYILFLHLFYYKCTNKLSRNLWIMIKKILILILDLQIRPTSKWENITEGLYYWLSCFSFTLSTENVTSVMKALAVAGLMNSTALRSVSLYRCSSSTLMVLNRLVIIMLMLDSTFCRDRSIPCWEVQSRKSSIPRISEDKQTINWPPVVEAYILLKLLYNILEDMQWDSLNPPPPIHKTQSLKLLLMRAF